MTCIKYNYVKIFIQFYYIHILKGELTKNQSSPTYVQALPSIFVVLCFL
jgi:hypothetical protein